MKRTLVIFVVICGLLLSACAPPATPAPVPTPQTIIETVEVVKTVVLNEGAEFGGVPFTGDARYLAIAVQCSGDSGFTSLSPRVALNPAPCAFALPGLWTQQSSTSPNLVGGYGSTETIGDPKWNTPSGKIFTTKISLISY